MNAWAIFGAIAVVWAFLFVDTLFTWQNLNELKDKLTELERKLTARQEEAR